MNIKHFLSTVAVAAMIVPGAVSADSPQVFKGDENAVSTEDINSYDANSPQASEADGEAGIRPIQLSEEAFDALSGSEGNLIATKSGEEVGVIERVNTNPQGYTELVVDIAEGSEIPADVLVVTVQEDNVEIRDAQIFLLTSVDELELEARKNSIRGDDGRVSVTLF